MERNEATSKLLHETAKGNQLAFEELCRTHRASLFRQAFKIVRNAETADEVVQDVLLGIWRCAAQFKGDSKPYTWIWAILRNKAIGALRSNRRSLEAVESSDREEATRTNPELDAVVNQALKRLTPEHRLALILTYYLNLSQAQVSSLTNCPVGTVKSRLSNALNQLRKVWTAPVGGSGLIWFGTMTSPKRSTIG